LYDIQPGNGAGLFLQPRSPHGSGLSTSNGMSVCTEIRGKKAGPSCPVFQGDSRSLEQTCISQIPMISH